MRVLPKYLDGSLVANTYIYCLSIKWALVFVLFYCINCTSFTRIPESHDSGQDGETEADVDFLDGDICIPDCVGRECGTDDCGGDCGECFRDQMCDSHGECRNESTPSTWGTIRSGSFYMGSPLDELGRWEDEIQHHVMLTHDFEIFSTEVTQELYNEYMGYNPSLSSSCNHCPVELVSWHEAAAYCNALSDSEGLETCYYCIGRNELVECEPRDIFPSPYSCPGYRLPTEAEWEYAARAGTTTATYNGDYSTSSPGCDPDIVADDIAWFCGNSGFETHRVGLLRPNNWGLYDMLGNVSEWCHDWYGEYSSEATTNPVGSPTGTRRIFRGGDFLVLVRLIRAADRSSDPPDSIYRTLGFRPARTLDF